MGILEDMIVKAKSAAEAVGEKAGNFMDVSKLNVSIAEENNGLKKKYEELGKCIYECEKNNDNQECDISDYINRIDMIKKNIEKMKKEVSILKNQVVCSSCGNRNGIDSKFCNNCGKELAIKCQIIKKEDYNNYENE